MKERAVRPIFWVSIIVAPILIVLILLGYWEWAVVGLIAAVVLNQLPFLHRRI